jgi:hypothetical protein
MRVYQFRQFRADKQPIAAIYYDSLAEGIRQLPQPLFSEFPAPSLNLCLNRCLLKLTNRTQPKELKGMIVNFKTSGLA